MNRVYQSRPEVIDRLEELGFSSAVLREAVAAGMLAWLSCSENHPPSFPGTYAWAETVRTLREGLIPSGWERFNDRNLPLTINRLTNCAMTASSGDECTGIAELAPRTRNPKGNATKERADLNAVQLGLFSDMTVPPAALLEEAAKWETWLLLMYRDFGSRRVRSELSRPINIGDDGRVDDWHERIILEEIPFDGDGFEMTKNGDNGGSSGRNIDGLLGSNDQSEVIDVPVRRKA